MDARGERRPAASRQGSAPPWLDDRRSQWLVDVTEWITDVVAALHLGSLASIIPVRERPWGAVLRVTTSDGVMYFKAEGLGARHEPRILAELARSSPGLGPEVLAAEGRRSWLLMADHGKPMWDLLDTVGQVATLERLLPLYAQMQASSSQSVDVWIDAGAPDRRVHLLPDLLDSLLAGEMAGGRLPIDSKQRRAIDMVLPDFARACEELATTPWTGALDHGDLHGGNVLVDGSGHRLVDWGDSCVTHPFSSLFVTYELAVSRFDRADRGAAALRLRDAYLEPWSRDGSSASLRETFTVAVWVGYVTRALDFVGMLQNANAALIREWQGHAVVLLRHWAAAHPLLSHGERFLAAIEP